MRYDTGQLVFESNDNIRLIVCFSDALIIGSACLLVNKEYTITVLIGTTLANNVLVDSVRGIVACPRQIEQDIHKYRHTEMKSRRQR